MNWKWLIFDGAISHACPGHLVDRLTRDLEQRGAPLVEFKDLTEMFLDQPGMCYTDRPTETVVLDGLSIEMPSEDVAQFVMELDKLKERAFFPVMQTQDQVLGVPYYKLHGFHRAVVLTPAQRQQLVANLRDLLPKAEQRAAEFYATRPTPGQALRTANSKVSGIPEEKLPDLGGHKLDRFILKPGGKA